MYPKHRRFTLNNTILNLVQKSISDHGIIGPQCNAPVIYLRLGRSEVPPMDTPRNVVKLKGVYLLIGRRFVFLIASRKPEKLQ